MATVKELLQSNQICIEELIAGPEEWRPVQGYRERYLVSSWGRMKRYDYKYNRYLFMVLNDDRKGYYKVDLYYGGKKTNKRIHRLVAEAFIDKADPKLKRVKHIDGNTKNNLVNNLKWVK